MFRIEIQSSSVVPSVDPCEDQSECQEKEGVKTGFMGVSTHQNPNLGFTHHQASTGVCQNRGDIPKSRFFQATPKKKTNKEENMVHVFLLRGTPLKWWLFFWLCPSNPQKIGGILKKTTPLNRARFSLDRVSVSVGWHH